MTLLEQFIDHYDPAWRLSDSALTALGRILDRVRPRRVLELGPGASSLVLVLWCLDHGAVYRGLDHTGEYNEKHRNVLREAGLPDGTTFDVPLDALTKWYAWVPPAINLVAPFDLIVIDGPPAGRDSLIARESYKKWGDPMTVWILDDTHRVVERRIAEDIAPGCFVERVADHKYPRYTDFVIPKELAA